jgi:hypothetical protein
VVQHPQHPRYFHQRFQKIPPATGVRVVREVAINTHHHDYKGHIVRRFKNLRATYGIMMLERVT